MLMSQTFTLTDCDAGNVLVVVHGRHVQPSDLQLYSQFHLARTSGGHVTPPSSCFRCGVDDFTVDDVTPRVAVQQERAVDDRPKL